MHSGDAGKRQKSMFFLVVLVLFYTFPVSSSPGTSLSKDEYVGCPDTSETRCGPRYNRFCSGSSNALYCDEAQGLCGHTAEFRDAQVSSKYDAASIPKSCLNICSSGLSNPSYSTLIRTGWKMENMDSHCGGNGTGWFGCPAPGNEVGSVSVKFTGQGLATLRYRNCQKMGKIEVVYEGKTLSHTDKKKEVTVNFQFEDNGMLTLKTRGYAVVNIISVSVDCNNGGCPAGFTSPGLTRFHKGNIHGDICRNHLGHVQGLGWACPSGCVAVDGPPYCKDDLSSSPCRVPSSRYAVRTTLSEPITTSTASPAKTGTGDAFPTNPHLSNGESSTSVPTAKTEQRKLTTKKSDFDKITQVTFTSSITEWVVRSVITFLALVVIGGPVVFIIVVVSRRGRANADDARRITPNVPQTLAIPASTDDPNGAAFELTQQESFGLHIWLAQRSFHGFESAFLQLGVTTVADLWHVSDAQLYSMGMDSILIARFKTEIGAYYTKHALEHGKGSRLTQAPSMQSDYSGRSSGEWANLLNTLPSRRRSSSGEASALPGLLTQERYSWDSSNNIKKQRSRTDPAVTPLRMPGYQSPRSSYCSSRDRSRSAGSVSSGLSILSLPSLGRSFIKESSHSGDRVFASVPARPHRRSKATTTATSVSFSEPAESTAQVIAARSPAVSCGGRLSFAQRLRKSNHVACTTILSSSTASIPSLRTSVSSANSVDFGAGRARDAHSPTADRMVASNEASPNAPSALSINVHSSNHVRSNPQSNSPSPHRQFFESDNDSRASLDSNNMQV